MDELCNPLSRLETEIDLSPGRILPIIDIPLSPIGPAAHQFHRSQVLIEVPFVFRDPEGRRGQQPRVDTVDFSR